MGTNLTFYAAAASFCAALGALIQRFGMSPTVAVQGTSVPMTHLGATAHKLAVARKADDRVPPRGRPL